MARNLFENNNQPLNIRPARNLFENYEQEPEQSFLQKLPRNIGAGLANIGHTFLNMPHDLAKNIEQQGQQFGGSIDKAFPLEKYGVNTPQYNFSMADQIPYQEEKNFSQMLGQKGEPTWADYLIQKGVEYTPEMILAGNALRNVVPHLTKHGATRTLNEARQLAEGRNIGTLNVDPELIKDARQFLPDTLPERSLLGASKTGDYNSLFNLQSNLGKISAKRMGKMRSLFSPETNIKGEAGLASRNRLLDAIHENLQAQGHNDISDLLRQGQNEYRRYMKFKPYRNAIGGAALTGAGSAIFPKNPLMDLVKKLMFHTGE